MMKHKVGVVGLRQAAGFINIFESYQGTNVTAICDINEALLHEVGERYGIEQRFTDYEEFIKTDIDIVELSTPIQVHGQQAIAAMRNGKHVLCQYIAANDLAEAQELLSVAKASGKKYMFIETDCYERRNRIMMELAKRGVLGELTWGRGEYIHDCKSLGYKPDGSYTWRGELRTGLLRKPRGNRGWEELLQEYIHACRYCKYLMSGCKRFAPRARLFSSLKRNCDENEYWGAHVARIQVGRYGYCLMPVAFGSDVSASD